MPNETLRDEKLYLEEIKLQLTLAVRRVDDAVRQSGQELRQKQEYLIEQQAGLDEADRVAADQSLNRMTFTGEAAVARKRRLLKLGQSPYFGRLDFAPARPAGQPAAPVYIGIYSFFDEQQRANRIYDWRAPISSMFYDFEPGPAQYAPPVGGPVRGIIGRKRQYRIRAGRLEFMLDSDVNIHDEVLQRELARSSDDKLKNIVATIQRDQNAVIRNDQAPVMVIQGVAGSGKTSIALHRIAFLLYRHRETIAARDILIISPNQVFADYISQVLPELGEEHIPELVMEELAADLLGSGQPFQTFFEQVAALLEEPDPAFVARIGFKSSFEFVGQLNQYLLHLENSYSTFPELRVGGVVVSAAFIGHKFRGYHRVPLLGRFALVAQAVREHVRQAAGRKLSGREKSTISQALARLSPLRSVPDAYRDFYRWLGQPELLRFGPHQQLEYADVFALIYLRLRLEGIGAYAHVKHLLVDEMQDYTPVQYAVLARLFPCRKTILGDVSQAVNPYSASSAETIERIFPQADVVRLHRSYRSTLEITAFAQRIVANPHIIPLERHGPPPAVVACASPAGELATLQELTAAFQRAANHSLGIICKTQRQAELIAAALPAATAQLLTPESSSFQEGIIIATAHLAKGLEFDEVIVPFATAAVYHTAVDRGLLYVACTRAMHQLTLTHCGPLTPLLASKVPDAST